MTHPSQPASTCCTSRQPVHSSTELSTDSPEVDPTVPALIAFIQAEFQPEIAIRSPQAQAVVQRMAAEIARICHYSDRIQNSGNIQAEQHRLARHRIQKYRYYYGLGSTSARVELHSHLSAIAYRYVAPARAHLGFQGRCTLLDDFLQSFYIEALKAFRREHDLPETYSPRVQFEVAEYLAFCEQYAKRKIGLSRGRSQQLLILRAQNFAKRQPPEASIDMEQAVDSPGDDDADGQGRSPILHQVRQKMVADTVDPMDELQRQRIVRELIRYLEQQDQQECIDYLMLRLEDFPAAEIDEIMGITARQRDYLQQRFKYHIEKFMYSHNPELVHQWLGASLEQNFGLTESDWEAFYTARSRVEQQLIDLKQAQRRSTNAEPNDTAIAKQLNWTPKQVNRRWAKLIKQAWQFRNR